MERGTLGWRQFLGAVNLKDFSGMVAAELGMIVVSLRLALQSLLRLPFGPFIALAGMLLALLRLMLLVLVVVVFGTAILAITVVRSVSSLVKGRPGAD